MIKNLNCTYAKNLVAHSNVEVDSLPKTFAEVANRNEKNIVFDMKSLREMAEDVKIEGSMAIVEMLK